MAKKKPGGKGNNAAFEKRLAKMQKQWDSTEKAGGSGGLNEHVSDGKQEAVLVGATLVETSGGNLMVEWTYKFPDADVDKKVLKKNPEADCIKARDGIESEKNISHLKKRLGQYGYDTEGTEDEPFNLAKDLPAILKELTKKQPRVAVVVKTSDDEQWQNVWVNRVLDDGDDEESEGDEEGDETEDGDEGEEAEIEVGSTVEHEKHGTCEVLKINKDDTVNLKTAKGKTVKKVPLDELTLAESEDEEEDEEEESDEESEGEGDEEESEGEDDDAIEKGDKVLYKPPKAKKQEEFEVVKVNDDDTLVIKSGKTKFTVKADKVDKVKDEEEESEDEDASEDEEEMGDLEKGSNVEISYKNATHKGKVVSINDKQQTVKVKIKGGKLDGKTIEVPQGDVELLD